MNMNQALHGLREAQFGVLASLSVMSETLFTVKGSRMIIKTLN